MENANPEFPDYGQGGDVAGARRGRRAFRLIVLSVLFLSSMLLLSERYLRHEHADRLYLMSLTLHFQSARAVLVQAIKYDAQRTENPTPKFTQALAVREESDVIVQKSREAYELDTGDTLYALRYGCLLYKSVPEEAASVFRAASLLPPQNALHVYLEAASLAKAGETAEALEEAMVLVARANNAGDTLIFPKPIWFSPSVLPQSGSWYAELSRIIYRETCAPLYEFAEIVFIAARAHAERGNPQNAKIWLEHMRVMGERLLEESEPSGTLPALAGVLIQEKALEELEAIGSGENQEADAASQEQSWKLENAEDLLVAFENGREERVTNHRSEHQRPLVLVSIGALIVVGAYMLMFIIYKIAKLDRSAWNIPHGSSGKAVLVVGAFLMLLILHSFTLIQHVGGFQEEGVSILAVSWFCGVWITVGFGLIYPLVALPAVAEVCRKSGRPEEFAELLPLARRAYRVAYLSLARRYYGLVVGVYLALGCVWLISYRMLTGLYPFALNVLTTGLLEEETQVVLEAIALLQ